MNLLSRLWHQAMDTDDRTEPRDRVMAAALLLILVVVGGLCLVYLLARWTFLGILVGAALWVRAARWVVKR